MPIRLCLLVAAFFVPTFALQTDARPSENDDPVVALPSEALILPSVGRYGRTPIPVDVLQAAICAGNWKTPKAGDTLTDADGKERKWLTIPFKGGRAKHSALGTRRRIRVFLSDLAFGKGDDPRRGRAHACPGQRRSPHG